MPADLATLSRLVRRAAREELLPRFADVKREWKADGSAVTVADHAMQARLASELAGHWPEYGFLGEEMGRDEQARALAAPGPGVWVLDPLDGTGNFAAGIPFFSVSLALLCEGRTAVGVVFDPVRDECFTAARGRGAALNGEPLGNADGAPPLERATAAVDFKRLEPELAIRLARQPPYSSQRSLGSVALDWCWIAAGRFHVYVHGRQKLWDYAAGELILAEAGGHSCTLNGEPVFRAAIEPRSAVAALDGGLFERWRAWICGPESLP